MYNYTNHRSDSIYKKTEYKDIEKIRMSVTTRGLSGLVNLGNTCYMNSIIQCISHLPMFSAYFRDGRHKNMIEKKSIDDKINISEPLSVLLCSMWENNYKIEPNTFRNTVGKINKNFLGYMQHDSQEFLNFLLDRIHEEINTKVKVNITLPENVMNYVYNKQKYIKYINNNSISNTDREKVKQNFYTYVKKNIQYEKIYNACIYWCKHVKDSYSIITTLFTGLEYSETICDNCNNVSSIYQPFTSLLLAIPSYNCSLEQCLQDFSAEETLDCEYNCSNCNTITSIKKNMYIWEPPEILIIYLKRFDNFGRKITSDIDIPLTSLNLDQCYSKYNSNDFTYDLVCVSTHKGSSMGYGHYKSYCKNQLNNMWYSYDDDTVIHIPDDDIKDHLTDSYILFYIKSVN